MPQLLAGLLVGIYYKSVAVRFYTNENMGGETPLKNQFQIKTKWFVAAATTGKNEEVARSENCIFYKGTHHRIPKAVKYILTQFAGEKNVTI